VQECGCVMVLTQAMPRSRSAAAAAASGAHPSLGASVGEGLGGRVRWGRQRKGACDVERAVGALCYSF
jgi:hypothetical protein